MADNLEAVSKKQEAYLLALIESMRNDTPEGALAKLKAFQQTGGGVPEATWVSKGGRVAIKGFGKGQPWGTTPERWNLIFKENEGLEFKGLLGEIRAMVLDSKANPDKYPVDVEEEEPANPDAANSPKAAETPKDAPVTATPAEKPKK